MAYNREQKFELAKEMIEKHKLFFIEDIPAFISINKSTFYEWWPLESNEYDELKGMLEDNRVQIKSSMRSKWYKSDNATLQMGLMKLICTDDERKKLAMTYSENENTEKQIILNIDPLADNDTTDNGSQENKPA